jgi:hypothetical protein
MSKIRGKDFAKTVIITPEERDAHKQMAAAKQQADANPVSKEPIIGGEVKGPPKGLSRWSIFFLVVIVLVLGVGFFIYSST